MADITSWLAALEERHLADLRVPEVTRALRALSSAYVERRRTGPDRPDRARVPATLDTAGKRAAFALFYAPLHFMTVDRVVRALGAEAPPPASIVDLGCGSGVAGAAWSLAAGGSIPVHGIDRHAWAVDEARWTYQRLGVPGRATRGDLARLPALAGQTGVVLAWALNELGDETRVRVENRLLEAGRRGVRVLIVEPIARGITPWWAETAARVTAAGGRADEWRFPVDRPASIERFDRAAGLDHRELTCRSLFLAV